MGEKMIERSFVKDLLGIEIDDFNDSIDICIGIGETWIRAELKGFPVPVDLQKTAALLYIASVYRNSVYETHTEQSSYLAKSLREEADNLVRIFKRQYGKYVMKVNDREEEKEVEI